jgi:predicted Na+-dependent transporter
MSNVAKAVIILLIVIPFIVSRVVILIEPLKIFIEKYKSYISDISIFIIIFYLFGLQNSQSLFEIYDFEPELIYISFIAVLVFYALVYFLSTKLYNMDSPQERAAFWHTLTRYITLALVISTFSISTFGTSMLLPIMFAYIVQIPFSAKVSQLQQKNNPKEKENEK